MIYIILKLALIFTLTTTARTQTTDYSDGFGNNVASYQSPLKTIVKRGQRSVLPCGGVAMTKEDDIVLWPKGGKVVGTYRVHTNNPEAEALIIERVKDEDTGIYRCRIVGYKEAIEEHIVEIDVIVPPLNVSIRTDNNVNFEAGSPRVLACVVYGCVPSLKVTWHLGDTKLRPNVYKEVNRGNFTVSSLTFVPSLTDNGKELVCKVTNSYLAKTFEDRVTISVGHRPLCIDSGFKTIGAIEGDTETLVCMVESDPEPEQFIWTFADGRSIYTSSKKVSGHESRYSSTLVWVPREDDFGPLYCRASNRFGEQKQPCTFSVISGGPPTTPECEIFWENKETIRVRCDKNWDGGRPQTIHLEIKGPDGTRKVSREGNELKVDSLRPDLNFTAELYATNSRGRSLAVQLTLLRPPPANLPPQDPYTTNASMTSTFIVITISVGFALLGFYTFYWVVKTYCINHCNCCCYSCINEDEQEMINMARLRNKNTSHIPTNGTVSSSMEFNNSSYVLPTYQSGCPIHDHTEANIPAPMTRPIVNPPRKRPHEAKIDLDAENYFL